jgi:hypothetical protein
MAGFWKCGDEYRTAIMNDLRFSECRRRVAASPNTFGRSMLLVLLGCTAVSSYAARMTIKGTCFLWLPLTWAVKPASRIPGATDEPMAEAAPILETLKLTRYGVAYRASLLLSAVVLTGVASKICLALLWNDIQTWWFNHVPDLIDLVVSPFVLQGWQIAAAINACMSFVLFGWADRILTVGKRPADDVLARRYAKVLIIKRCLAIYILTNTLAMLWLWYTRHSPLNIIFVPFYWMR